VIIDIYSRKTVGWMVASRESAVLAEQLLATTIAAENVPAGQLTIHADRGSSMASKPVALLLADLGVIKSHSRPRVSNDNPYSESQFKTLKYCPSFPGSFTTIEDARAFCADFFDAYNHHHRHAGLGLLTPAVVHAGQAETVRAKRALVLDAAHVRHRNRFRRPPKPTPSAGARLDQPTSSDRGRRSQIVHINCPEQVDRFRSSLAPGRDLRQNRALLAQDVVAEDVGNGSGAAAIQAGSEALKARSAEGALVDHAQQFVAGGVSQVLDLCVAGFADPQSDHSERDEGVRGGAVLSGGAQHGRATPADAAPAPCVADSPTAREDG
jgi:hypothetical protein